MLDDVRILAIGLAAVIDTVLLLAMWEKPNRRHVAVWMLLLAGGAWLWHAGSFLHVLLAGTGELGHFEWRVPVRLVMAAGLLLMPASLLHGVLRLWRYGLAQQPRDPRLLLAYLPLCALGPIALALGRHLREDFLVAVEAWVGPYLVWLGAVNLLAAVGFLVLRTSIRLPRADVFFRWMAVTLVGVTAVAVLQVLYGRQLGPPLAGWLELVVIVSPVAPGMVFAYFVVRHRFAPLIVERSLIYGGILLGLMLLHRVVVETFRDELSERYRIDLAVVEGVLGLVLVLSYAPLRRRIAQAVHKLLGSSPDATRRAIGALSVELSSRAGQPPGALFAWFVESLPGAIQVEYAAGWLFDTGGTVCLRAGDSARLDDAAVAELDAGIRRARTRVCTWADPACEHGAGLLEAAEAAVAMIVERSGIRGLIVLGRQPLNQPPGEEELAALVLLVEQAAAALDNSRLLAERRAAEDRAAQAEKLSMLGLLAGSIAHEIKNPLSSIKTLAAVLAEDLGPDSPHTGDLRLVQAEIDRLARTTSQLLEFSRPARAVPQPVCVVNALERTLAVLGHLARQRDVTIETTLSHGLPAVSISEAALREVFFNLLLNSVEAAGPGGRVTVACRQHNGCVVAEVHDTGPGLPPDVRERLFEPFVSTKDGGTGLGLYTAARRLQEAGGRIGCECGSGAGTTFRIELPCEAKANASRE
jgi:signal transduction histidine kinase